MKSQIEFAEKIIDLLRRSGKFESVSLVGSLSKGQFDEMSDIDITISSSKRSPYENIVLAICVLRERLQVDFYDWAKSLLPEKYLVSVFFHEAPLYWFVDISCYKSEGFPDKKREEIDQDSEEHKLKLWIANSKEQLRGNIEKNQIDVAFKKYYSDFDSDISDVQKFRIILDDIKKDRFSPKIVDECSIVMARILTNQLNFRN